MSAPALPARKSKFNRRSSKQKADAKSHRSDMKYKEIRRLLAKKQRERAENTEKIVEEL